MGLHYYLLGGRRFAMAYSGLPFLGCYFFTMKRVISVSNRRLVLSFITFLGESIAVKLALPPPTSIANNSGAIVKSDISQILIQDIPTRRFRFKEINSTFSEQ